MDKRRKLTSEQVDEVLSMVDKGMTLESVGRAMGVSTSHVQRMRATHNKGEVKAITKNGLEVAVDNGQTIYVNFQDITNE